MDMDEFDKMMSGKSDNYQQNNQASSKHPLFDELSNIPEYATNAALNFFPKTWDMLKGAPEALENTGKKIYNEPVGAMRDFYGSLAREGQNIAASGLEAGEYITRKGAEQLLKDSGINGEVPKWNAREFAGLEGKNQVNLGDIIQSKNPDPLLSNVGQIAGSFAGGASIPKFIAANAMNNAINAQPGERTQAATEGAVNAAIPGVGAKILSKGIPATYNYLHPEKASEEFRSTLGQGNSRQNIESLGSDIQASKQKAMSEALAVKDPFFAKYGKDRVIKNAADSPYLTDANVADYYLKKSKTEAAHNAYQTNPTLENYDKLQSALKDRARDLKDRVNDKTITDRQEQEYVQLKHNINNLNQDISGFTEKLPEKDKAQEKEWRTKYAEGVGHYENAPVAIRKLAEGKGGELTSAQVGNAFTKLTPATKKVIGDMSPATVKKILYNATLKVGMHDAGGLADTILDLHRTKGYGHLIDNETLGWANNMKKHVRNADLIKQGLASAGGAAAGSHFGILGSAAGATVPWVYKLGKIVGEKRKK